MFTLFAKIDDGTTFGLPFRSRGALVSPFSEFDPRQTDFVFEDGSGRPLSFRVNQGPVSIAPVTQMPVLVRVGSDAYRVDQQHQLSINDDEAQVDLGWQMSLVAKEVPPKYQFSAQDIQTIQQVALPPCTLDKAALGGPDAILAVAKNPYLRDEFYWRWAKCPWVPALRALAVNPGAPRDLRDQLAYLAV